MVNLQSFFNDNNIDNWDDISSLLDSIKNKESQPCNNHNIKNLMGKDIAFITFDFGIDGVSIEIAKYAKALEKISGEKDFKVSMIAGDFYKEADIVLEDRWSRHSIDGINGWEKWFGGKTFDKLFFNDMPEGKISDNVAKDLWKDVELFSTKIANYLIKNDIKLIIPVNCMSNPGNVALALSLVIVSELLDTFVLSSNHDYYWEGGKPAEKRKDGEIGPRDYFFRNMSNKSFFNLFTKLYPWNGEKWLQVNINSLQSDTLKKEYAFDENLVHELETSVSDNFFEEFSIEDQKQIRKTMAYILSDGKPLISPVNIKKHIAQLADWMQCQKPVVCGFSDNLTLDITTTKTIYLLQPTRVVGRKRIEKNFEMLAELFKFDKFLSVFKSDPEYQLVVHITGPVPIEHQTDLNIVLDAYKNLCESVDLELANRIFIAFSVGTEDHPALVENKLNHLSIEKIYRLADIVLFPSETEGRGLPIIESSACGIPIICSCYYPKNVFYEVVGEHLDFENKLQYILFPEDKYSPAFLEKVTQLLFHKKEYISIKEHNKQVVLRRYGNKMIENKFENLLKILLK